MEKIINGLNILTEIEKTALMMSDGGKEDVLMVLASTWEDVCVCMFSPQSCPALCEAMDYSLPGSSEVCGIFQVRIHWR